MRITCLLSDEKHWTNLRRNRDTEEVNKTDVFVPDDLDLINQTEPAEIVPQLFFGCILIQTAKVHVSACVALLNCQCDLTGDWGILSPTNLQLLSVQGQFLDDSVGIELGGSGSIQKGQENTGLLREHPDGFEGTKVNKVEKLVHGGGGGEIADVNGAAGYIVGGTKSNLEGSGRILCLLVDPKLDRELGIQQKGVFFTWKLFIWLLYGNPPMVPKTFIAGRPIPNML